MAADVEIVLAARAGVDAQQSVRLQKMCQSIENGLNWLEYNSGIFSIQLSYIDFSFSMHVGSPVYYPEVVS